ncbi:MAG TPA: metallophosphoesterase [Myxococcota bacterium]|nr:metallophosphoesterase [Myxococcota bacterium]HRY97085.1 metallophosphoesterase [Myxococcota bacterium]HSA21125.1 metallophosphoesterase [Myxococcota bacterium]
MRVARGAWWVSVCWLGASLGACSDAGGPDCQPLQARPFEERADPTFLRGPWLFHATSDRLVFGFDTAEACQGTVELGRPGEALAPAGEEAASRLEHQLEVAGLAPDTRYAYRLRCGALESQEHTAYTAPAPGAAVRFAVLGDTQSHPEVSARVVREVLPFEPAFLLHVGDAVGGGAEQSAWDEQFYPPLEALQDHAPVYAALGSHEQDGYGYHRRSPGELLSPESPEDSCYAFSAGNLFVLVMSTEGLFFPVTEEVGTPISEWIERVVASPEARAATWRVAIGHQPARVEGWTPGNCEPPTTFSGNPFVAGWLLPLLAEHGFQAYFSGHTHAYERGEVAGVHTFVTGGGGGDLDELCRELPEIAVFRSVHHHLRVTAGCDQLTVEAWALDEAAPFDRVDIPASTGAGEGG